MATPPLLMTQQQFKAVTKIGILKGRKNLERIDNLLKDAQFLASLPPERRDPLLQALLVECQAWIDKKDAKTQARIAQGKDESSNTARRRSHVEKLFMQAVARLNFYQFEGRKTAYGSSAHPMKPLAPGYGPERQQFVGDRNLMKSAGTYGKGQKISPIGGGMTHDFTKYDTPQPFAAATVATYRQAYAWWKNTENGLNNAARVAYMRKHERLEHMVTFNNRKLYHHGKVMHHPADARGTMIYAMDCYGNLFAMVAESKNVRGTYADGKGYDVLPDGDSVQLNHSALNAGNDVICAGTLVVNNGDLLEITNMSGHYQPTRANLAECVKVLVGEGVVTRGSQVSVMVAGSMVGPFPAGPFGQHPEAYV